jgi:hypothetical protein
MPSIINLDVLLKTGWRHGEKGSSAPFCRTLRCSTYAYTPPRQQEPGITAHLNPFLRASSHFSLFYQPFLADKIGIKSTIWIFL